MLFKTNSHTNTTYRSIIVTTQLIFKKNVKKKSHTFSGSKMQAAKSGKLDGRRSNIRRTWLGFLDLWPSLLAHLPTDRKKTRSGRFFLREVKSTSRSREAEKPSCASRASRNNWFSRHYHCTLEGVQKKILNRTCEASQKYALVMIQTGPTFENL